MRRPPWALRWKGARAAARGVRLEGRFIRVVPFDLERHGADIFAASHGPEREALWVYLSVGPFADETSFRETYAALAARRTPCCSRWRMQATGKAVGHACYMRIEPAQRVIEVGNISSRRFVAFGGGDGGHVSHGAPCVRGSRLPPL